MGSEVYCVRCGCAEWIHHHPNIYDKKRTPLGQSYSDGVCEKFIASKPAASGEGKEK